MGERSLDKRLVSGSIPLEPNLKRRSGWVVKSGRL